MEEEIYEERFAISGAVTLAIGEFDSKTTQMERESDAIEWRDDASEWAFQYREHLLELVETVLKEVVSTTSYGQLSIQSVDAAEYYAQKMIAAYTDAAYE